MKLFQGAMTILTVKFLSKSQVYQFKQKLSLMKRWKKKPPISVSDASERV